jgi:hypothetical protein
MVFFLLFAKYLPIIAASEVKGILPGSQPSHHHHDDEHVEANGHAKAH